MTRSDDEPALRPEASGLACRATALFARVESLLIAVVAAFLIAFVVIALLAVVREVWGPLVREGDFGAAAIRGTDATFLAIILLELLHTTLSRGPIGQQLQEFLAIGVTPTVGHGLDIAASRTSGPREIVVDLAINAGEALVLVVALWLVRQQLRADRREARRAGEEGGGDATDGQPTSHTSS